MNSYIIGLLAAFVEPISHGWANILDNYLSNKIFQKIDPLIFFSQIFGLLVLPIIILIDPPHFLPIKLIGIIFVIAVIEVSYLFPYYYALRHADTSVIAALFSLGKLFIPLFAFLFISERLTTYQYIGFLILTLSSVALSFDFKKMNLSRAFISMSVVSVLLAVQSILLKYVYQAGVSWGSSIVWMIVFQVIIVCCFLLSPKKLKEITSSLGKLKSVWKLFLLMEIFSWGGILGGYYALFLIPVTVAKGVAGTQPIFVLLYAFLFAKFAPNIFKEHLGKEGVVKKIILFILTIIGVVLI